MIKKLKPYLPKFLVSIILPILVGLLSAFFTKDNMGIYNEINNPPLSPPGWLFPIAWGILYILMGISSCIVFINREKDIDAAVSGLRFYAISLIFNFVWSIIFFNLRMFLLAFIWLLALLLLIILTIVKYNKISPIAAYLQIPYCLWVAFAGYLTLGTYLLN